MLVLLSDLPSNVLGVEAIGKIEVRVFGNDDRQAATAWVASD